MLPDRVELDRLAGAYLVVDAVDGDRRGAVEHVQDLPGAVGVVGGAQRLSGFHPPVPQLDQVGFAEPTEQTRQAAVRAAPQHRRVIGSADPYRALLGRLQQPGDADAERVGDPAERADARVGAGTLDLHEHALADAGPAGQFLEGPAAGGSQLMYLPGDR